MRFLGNSRETEGGGDATLDETWGGDRQRRLEGFLTRNAGDGDGIGRRWVQVEGKFMKRSKNTHGSWIIERLVEIKRPTKVLDTRDRSK
ncbi:hypothetical protein L1887_02161 [Cichorium endivia]|nr:hypothetical protein L1887_02161 [Cichorium endivia]